MRISHVEKLSLLCLLLVFSITSAGAQDYAPALPGFHYHFPRDHFNHPEYQTEWWYYTGNLRARDGHRFGFELTFFREAVSRKPAPTPWAIDDVYMAHLALTDVNGKRYYATERINRAGPGIAGINESADLVWNGNWSTKIDPSAHTLHGVGDNFSLDLEAKPRKQPVVHGLDGISQKAEGKGHASHYVSFTRMDTGGTLQLDGTRYTVEGDAWMDHEFFSDPMNGDEVGWDWLSLQLDDNSELMLYRLRHKDGSVDPYSSGTFVDKDGRTLHLALTDFTMTSAGTTWKSPTTGGTYPLSWAVSVPRLGLQVDISTPVPSQEFISRFGPSYWEGTIDINGHRGALPVHGTGYLEMTGYAPARSNLVSGAPR